MVNPVSNSDASYAQHAVQPAAVKPQPQQSTPLPSDTVKLQSTGDVDHDGDSH